MKPKTKTLLSAAIAATSMIPSMAAAQDTYNWTGWSGGISLSSISGDGAQAPAVAAIGGIPDQSPDGFALGGQIAYDNQFSNNMVLGVVADVSFANADGSVADGNFLRQTSEINSLGGLKARIGYASGKWMTYATLGLGFANVGYGQSCPAGAGFGTCATSGAYSSSGDSFQTGVSAGFGVRYGYSEKLILGLDYSFTDLGGDFYNFQVPGNALPSTRYFDTEIQVLKFTMDWRF
ncbi:outer membrane protein [Tateyamaria sp.]|uniref:outer membrane protein n=1 Tax=Tateyamaria sp. TaxID=1929288 RepID=UPI00329B8B68